MRGSALAVMPLLGVGLAKVTLFGHSTGGPGTIRLHPPWQYHPLRGPPMNSPTAKQRILEAVQQLPPDVTMEEAIERLVFPAKIERGLRDADAGRVVSHEEARRRWVR